MIRLTKLADYGVVLLSQFAARPDAESINATELAEYTRIPLPTVSKLLKLLTRAEVLTSIRGAKGGYRLARPAESLTLAEAIVALDGPIALTVCCGHQEVDGELQACAIAGCCTVKVNWQRINVALEKALSAITLADMINPKTAAVPTADDLVPRSQSAAELPG